MIQIIGQFRSGTTLLASRISSSKSINISDETHLFRRRRLLNILIVIDNLFDLMLAKRFVTHRLRRQGWSEKSISKLCQRLKNYQNFKNLYEAVISENYGESGDNTPANIFHVERLHKYFPKVKFIIMQRDEKEIFASANRLQEFQYNGMLTLIHVRYRENLIQQYKKKRILNEKNSLFIGYHDLVNHCEDVEAKLITFLGHNDIQLGASVTNHVFKNVASSKEHHTNLLKPIMPSNKNKYSLLGKQQKDIYRRNKNLLDTFQHICPMKIQNLVFVLIIFISDSYISLVRIKTWLLS